MTTYAESHTDRAWFNSLFNSLRRRIDTIEVRDTRIAKIICKLIPPSCPFARDIKLFSRTILHIPPLCHFNPVYEELIALRFRALIYLSE